MAMSVAQWRSGGTTAELLGHEMFYMDSGEPGRPTIFLIHGFPTASWDWAEMWDELHETHRLVALDMLGFGFSAKPRGHRYSIMEQADLCEALVQSLRLTEFHVIAHDYGDTVAQELLARQNEGSGRGNWLSACLLNGGLFPETHRPRLIQKVLLSPAGGIATKLLSKKGFTRSFSAVFGPDTKPSPQDIDAFWQLINHNGGKQAFSRLIHYMPERERYRDRWVRALRDSAVPLGLINGSVDPVSGAHMVTRYREVVSKDHYIVELPRIGHYPQVEAPDAVLDAYLRFLQSV
ncbi:MAG: alpha/beta hydrolase [Myxococcota bacterium]